MNEVNAALVTGASRGIGAAIAARLAADGLFVVGTATSDQGAQSISNALGDSGVGMQLQVRDPASVAAFFADLKSQGHAPSVLVNNAGVTRDNLMLRMSEEEWFEVMDTNLSGVYRVTKPLLRGMIKARWGRIVNVGSVVGRLGNAGQANYVASKAGIEGFTRSLASEVASRGITVNCVAPGFIQTDMTDQLSDSQTAEMLQRIPLGRLGQVSDIAATVSFLCGADAGYITGQSIQVNGGMLFA